MRVCEKGKLKVKRTRDITNAQKRISERTLGKRDCTWYGEAYCHGDEVIVSTCKNKRIATIYSYSYYFRICTDGGSRWFAQMAI